MAAPVMTAQGGADDRASSSCASDVINAAVAAAFVIPIIELRAPTRRPAPIALARQSAMYLAHVACGLTFTEVGRAFGRDRTTAAHACRRIEDRRREARLDAALADLEHVLRRDLAATGAVS